MENINSRQGLLFPTPKFKDTSWEQDEKIWKEITGVKLQVDGFMSAMLGKRHIDIIKIDENLRKYHGNRYNNNSLWNFVYNNFGEDIVYLLDKWTQI